MKAKVDLVSQRVTGITPKGEEFVLDFEITNRGPGFKKIDVNAILAHQPEASTPSSGDEMILTSTVEINPGQVLEMEFELPQHMQRKLCKPWKEMCKNWLPEIFSSFNEEVLWEPSTYQITEGE